MRLTAGRGAALGLTFALATVAAWTARVPSEGPLWRGACVAAMLAWAAVALGPARQGAVSAWTVLVVALGLRLLVFPMPPVLSDDAYRYLWDGLVQTHASPYAFTPREALAVGMPGWLFEQLNSPDYFSVYPPASQALFRLSALSGAGWWWTLKAVLVVAEMGGMFVLARHVPARALALYAWHPVAVVEIAGQGHTEGLAVGALWLAVLAARAGTGGAAFAVAAWTKLVPLGLVAVLARRGGAGWVLSALAATLLLTLPVVHRSALGHVGQSLSLYLETFDWYHLPYSFAKWALYPCVGEASGAWAGRMGSAIALSVIAIAALIDDGSDRRGRTLTFAVLATALLATPTLHPWHGLLALAAVPLVQHGRWVVVLLAVAPLTYGRYVGLPGSYEASLALGWGLAAAVAFREANGLARIMARRGRGKWMRISPHLGALRPGARVLDLGAGEGHVGAEAAAERGVAVTLADVAAFGAPSRPVVRVDGPRLPFGDRAFDATLLVFVLHHARDPRTLLSEALRVTRGPVAVLETVWVRPWQRRPLEALDRVVNRLRSGHAMDPHVALRSAEEWRTLAHELGATVELERRTGGLHPQALFILRRGS